MNVAAKKKDEPDPEVTEGPERRRFSAEYKLRILREADACQNRGEVGALLRREGLYSSHLTMWRKLRESGALQSLEPKKRGRKPGPRRDPVAREAERLKKENERLRRQLEQAEKIIEIQKKVSEMLGIPLSTDDNEGSD